MRTTTSAPLVLLGKLAGTILALSLPLSQLLSVDPACSVCASFCHSLALSAESRRR